MIFPYKMESEGAIALSKALGTKLIKREGSKFKGNKDKVVINWGAINVSDEVAKCTVINKPEAVAKASDKLTFFNTTKGKLDIPEFTIDAAEALKWIEDGLTILARTKLNGHSGEGIHILQGKSEWDNFNHMSVKVYVKYIPKKDEYRVHVLGGKVLDIRRKALRADFSKDMANWKIRNHKNGFIFAKENINAPKEVYQNAVKAISLLGLDFGAVDVIWNNFRNKAYVLEINTAPGLEGSTVDNYKAGFELLYKDGVKQKLSYGNSLDSVFAHLIAEANHIPMNPPFFFQENGAEVIEDEDLDDEDEDEDDENLF
jgi:glutathione synthase/RimK-type ligase-like ATP-grasp enzyme